MTGKYKIIYADPPWSYQDSGCNGAAGKQYDTMSHTDIAKLPVQDMADDDSVLFMWGTWPLFEQALVVISAWGFTYKSVAFVWVKQNKSKVGYFYGLGRWTRGNTEFCLLATRGKPKRVSSAVEQLIVEPIRGHSAKPDVTREKIVTLMGDLPRVELFARVKHPGWDAYGRDIGTLLTLEGIVEVPVPPKIKNMEFDYESTT